MKKIAVGIIGSILIVGSFSFVLDDNAFDISKNIDIFTTLYRELNTNYVDELSTEALITDGINAMLASLDPYTTYIPESKLEDYQTATTGEYGGIGAVVIKKDGINTVIMPYVGFPAHSAGLRIGDQIHQINHQNLVNKSTSEISALLKGQPGTPIVLTVKSYGVEEMKEISLDRAKITIDNVMYFGMYSDDIGIIKLSGFTTNASSEVDAALDSLKTLGATKIILDLRDNPGGLLDEAIKVANVFIEQGKEVVITKGKQPSWNKTYKTPFPTSDSDIPVAVLTSRATASAAEIVSGVIQDYDRGVLIGARTFGKGLVQATRSLPYNAQLKLTTAKYYIPSGRCIQAIDYANRNEDGSVGKLPDSLKVAFETSNGRVVYDGGGINPDIAVKPTEYSNFLFNLVEQDILFDYANEYAFKNKDIESPRTFEISDEEYASFVSWVESRDVNLATQMDEAIAGLEAKAKKEKYYEGMKPSIEKLKKKVEGLKDNFLTTFSKEIKYMLKTEIVSRYYFHLGILEASLDYDRAVSKAAEVLNDPVKYNQILNK